MYVCCFVGNNSVHVHVYIKELLNNHYPNHKIFFNGFFAHWHLPIGTTNLTKKVGNYIYLTMLWCIFFGAEEKWCEMLVLEQQYHSIFEQPFLLLQRQSGM